MLSLRLRTNNGNNSAAFIKKRKLIANRARSAELRWLFFISVIIVTDGNSCGLGPKISERNPGGSAPEKFNNGNVLPRQSGTQIRAVSSFFPGSLRFIPRVKRQFYLKYTKHTPRAWQSAGIYTPFPFLRLFGDSPTT